MADSRRFLPLRMALLYVVVAGLWILLSDMLVQAAVPPGPLLTRLQTYKGWGFVLVTGGLLYLVLSREVQRQLRADAALRASEAQYRLLFENNPIAMWVYDRETLMFLAVNDAALDNYGYSRAEFGRMTLADLRSPAEYAALQQSVRTGTDKLRRPGVWKHKRKDGSWIDVEITTHDVDYQGRPGRLVLASNVTERLQADAALRHLSGRLAEVQENERRDLARELHDRVGQDLTALNITLTILRSQLPQPVPAALDERIDEALRLVEATVEGMRDVMAELRPPALDDYGLPAALRWLAEQFTRRTGLGVTVSGSDALPRPPLNTETGLFRIAQEALNNTAKHARATAVQITLSVTDDGLTRLIVADDGVGFDAAAQRPANTWGLLTMRERAMTVGAQLAVESGPGQGTRVVVEAPAG